MDGNRILIESRRILAAYVAMAACFATASQAEVVEGAVEQETSFKSEFADIAAPTRDYEIVSGAVDITLIDPPIEIEPVPTLRSLGSGVASYYGRRFHGRRTANGERFNMNAMTAAHRTLPFGSLVEVTNPRNGRSVVVRINDRGPFIRGRTIDLSRAAAKELGMISRGHAQVELALFEE